MPIESVTSILKRISDARKLYVERTFSGRAFTEGIDLVRSQVAVKQYYGLAPGILEPGETLVDGTCLVHVPPREPGKPFRTVTVSTGAPSTAIFAGFKLGDGFPMVTVGSGHFHVYTLLYDKNAEWALDDHCLPIPGPDGLVTTGAFPDDHFRAIGRVVQLPTKHDPYLGLAGFAHA